jgi:hypothetical protein
MSNSGKGFFGTGPRGRKSSRKRTSMTNLIGSGKAQPVTGLTPGVVKKKKSSRRKSTLDVPSKKPMDPQQLTQAQAVEAILQGYTDLLDGDIPISRDSVAPFQQLVTTHAIPLIELEELSFKAVFKRKERLKDDFVAPPSLRTFLEFPALAEAQWVLSRGHAGKFIGKWRPTVGQPARPGPGQELAAGGANFTFYLRDRTDRCCGVFKPALGEMFAPEHPWMPPPPDFEWFDEVGGRGSDVVGMQNCKATGIFGALGGAHGTRDRAVCRRCFDERRWSIVVGHRVGEAAIKECMTCWLDNGFCGVPQTTYAALELPAIDIPQPPQDTGGLFGRKSGSFQEFLPTTDGIIRNRARTQQLVVAERAELGKLRDARSELGKLAALRLRLGACDEWEALIVDGKLRSIDHGLTFTDGVYEFGVEESKPGTMVMNRPQGNAPAEYYPGMNQAWCSPAREYIGRLSPDEGLDRVLKGITDAGLDPVVFEGNFFELKARSLFLRKCFERGLTPYQTSCLMTTAGFADHAPFRDTQAHFQKVFSACWERQTEKDRALFGGRKNRTSWEKFAPKFGLMAEEALRQVPLMGIGLG